MTAEAFFSKFELFAGTPDAVAKMRAMIITLGSLGKLVPQDRNDESASKLVRRIETAREGLRAKKQPVGEPIDAESLPQLPDSWRWVHLGNVVDYGSSDKVDSTKIRPGDWLLDLEDIQKDTSRLVRRKVFADSPSLSTKTRFVTGDVLYGKLRPYLNKVVVADSPGYCTTEIIPIRAHGFIDPEYLCYALRREDFVAYAVSKCYGMNLPRLGTDDARRAPFPLPPLAEQKRIVAKLKELMALCDRLEAQQKEREAKQGVLARAVIARFAESPTPANLEYLFHNAYTIRPADLRKSILTMAVQGRLVGQEPHDGNASDLLNAIDEMRSGVVKGKRYKRNKDLREIDLGKCPHPIPNNWSWTHLGDLVLEFRYGTSRKCDRTPSGVPVLRIPNIQGGRIDSSDLKFTEMPKSEFDDLRLAPGDLVLVRSNGSEALVGRCAVATVGDDHFAYAGYLVRARTSTKHVFSPYIQLALSEASVRDQIERPIRTTSGVKNVNTTELANLVFPLPPLAEQHRIVEKVDLLMALVDRLEVQLAESQTLAQRLIDAVVAQLTHPTKGEDDLESKQAVSADSASAVITQGKAAATDLFGIRHPSEQYLRIGATVAALIIPRIGNGQGKTYIEKTLHLVESFCDLPMGRKPKRMAHGPADLNQHDAIMEWAAEADIFLGEPSEEGKRVDYTRGDAFNTFLADATRILGGKLTAVENLIAELRPLSSRNAEWVATAYGSWNDFIKDGVAEPTDDEIIKDIYTHWHISKRDVAEKDWRWALNWLRDRNVIPTGKGPRVAGP